MITLDFGDQVIVTIEGHEVRSYNKGNLIGMNFVEKLSAIYEARAIKAGAVAKIGDLYLTAGKAAQVRAALEEEAAKDLKGAREILAKKAAKAADEWSYAHDANVSHMVETSVGSKELSAAEVKANAAMDAANKALKEFDEAHPEIVEAYKKELDEKSWNL
jgi:hypothetical protein